MTLIGEMMSKQVVNGDSGKVLGNIYDMEVDASGRITCLKIRKKKGMFSLKGSGETVVVKWEDIQKSDGDVILIKGDGTLYVAGGKESADSNIWGKIRDISSVLLLILSVLILIKSCIG